MTQAELADKLGVTNKAVSKWETGEAMPETAQLVPLSQIFGVTVDELLKGERNKNGEKQENEEWIDEAKKHLFTRGKDDKKTLFDVVGGAVCSALFFICTAAYLILGALTNLWHPYWIMIPVGALSCGIIGIIFDMCNRRKREEKLRRGENPFIGGACGLIILSCLITYLLLGALLNAWHPYWIIVVTGALVCGALGTVGEVLKKKGDGDED